MEIIILNRFTRDEVRTTDPPVSGKQERAMYAALGGHSTLGIPKAVAKKFVGPGHDEHDCGGDCSCDSCRASHDAGSFVVAKGGIRFGRVYLQITNNQPKWKVEVGQATRFSSEIEAKKFAKKFAGGNIPYILSESDLTDDKRQKQSNDAKTSVVVRTLPNRQLRVVSYTFGKATR